MLLKQILYITNSHWLKFLRIPQAYFTSSAGISDTDGATTDLLLLIVEKYKLVVWQSVLVNICTVLELIPHQQPSWHG